MICPPTILLYLSGAEGHAWRYFARNAYPGWMAILFRFFQRYHRQAVLWVATLEWLYCYETRRLELNLNPTAIIRTPLEAS